MIETAPSIRCEIVAADSRARRRLVQIVRACAIDLKLSLPIEALERAGPLRRAETEIALRVPARMALARDAAWSLACRVACYCPDALISTSFVNCEEGP